MDVGEYLNRLEKNLMIGSARWVTEFVESFRELDVAGVRFAMLLRGSMRTKGLLLSRLFSYLAMPNYRTSCLVRCGGVDERSLRATLRAADRHMRDHGVDWAWVVLAHDVPFDPGVVRAVEKMNAREAGVALVDVSSRTVLTDLSLVGRKMRDHVRCWR